MPVDIFGHTIGVSDCSDVNANSITIGQLNNEFLRRDGAFPATESLDMGNKTIINMAYPVNQFDGANLLSVQSIVADYVKRDGTLAMTGQLNMGNFKINSLANPETAADAANRNYVDGYVATQLTDYVRKDGTTAMTGDFNLNTHFAYGMLDPIIAQDGATKNYVDGRIAAVNAVVSNVIATSTVANVSVYSNNAVPIPITLTPVVLTLDPAKINNPSDPSIIDLISGSAIFRIKKPGTYTIVINALFQNTTTTEIIVTARLLNVTTQEDLITIAPLPCTAKPNVGAPNTTTAFTINNQFTVTDIPPVPGWFEVSMYTQASTTGAISLFREGYLALSITQESEAYLPLSGGSMSGDIDMGQNMVTNLKAPASDNDATRKLYVDTLVAGLSPAPFVDYVYFEKIGLAAGGVLPWVNMQASTNFSTYFSRGPVDGTYQVINQNYFYIFNIYLTKNETSISQILTAMNSQISANTYMYVNIPADNPTNTVAVGQAIVFDDTVYFQSLSWNNLEKYQITVTVVNKWIYGAIP